MPGLVARICAKRAGRRTSCGLALTLPTRPTVVTTTLATRTSPIRLNHRNARFRSIAHLAVQVESATGTRSHGRRGFLLQLVYFRPVFRLRYRNGTRLGGSETLTCAPEVTYVRGIPRVYQSVCGVPSKILPACEPSKNSSHFQVHNLRQVSGRQLSFELHFRRANSRPRRCNASPAP